MANGDKAAAAGLATWTNVNDVRLTYDFLNVRGDELAEHMTNGTHPIGKIPGLATALAGKLDDAEASVNANANTLPRRDAAGMLTVQPTPTLGAHAASKTYVDSHAAALVAELADVVDALAARVRDLENGGA